MRPGAGLGGGLGGGGVLVVWTAILMVCWLGRASQLDRHTVCRLSVREG